MGRPRKNTPEREAHLSKEIEELGAIHCTWKEVAAVTGEDYEYLIKRFSEEYQKGKERGKKSLRRAMFEHALKGNTTLLIWLSKQHLGMVDKQEIDQKVESKQVDVTTLASELRQQLLNSKPPGSS